MDHALFEPSFPTENMSTKELEYGALSPARVSARMKKGLNKTKIFPWKDQTFRASFLQNFNEISLIPGGRYLLTGSNTAPSVGVSLWDLGMNPTPEMPMVPIATIAKQVGLIDSSPTPDGLGFLVTTYFADVG